MKRSKWKVSTALLKMVEKRSRITARDISRSALGTHCTTRDLPSASRSERSGPTTVVLPAPMIIWWHTERPSRTASMNLPMSATCDSRRIMVEVNSVTRKRGS